MFYDTHSCTRVERPECYVGVDFIEGEWWVVTHALNVETNTIEPESKDDASCNRNYCLMQAVGVAMSCGIPMEIGEDDVPFVQSWVDYGGPTSFLDEVE